MWMPRIYITWACRLHFVLPTIVHATWAGFIQDCQGSDSIRFLIDVLSLTQYIKNPTAKVFEC